MLDFSIKLKKKNNFPLIMGIVNITPDSFSDGGKYFDTSVATNYAKLLIEEGADIIDIGGESTRPGSLPVSEQEEIDRVIPVVENIKNIYPEIILSVDTNKYNVAKYALDAGTDIINDISGLTNAPEIAQLTASHNKYLVIMHIKGSPQLMQVKPHYNNVVKEVFDFFSAQIDLAKNFGTKKIIIDVGIGFGKNYEHNLELLRNLDEFEKLEHPMLLGISRKSFIGKMLGIENPENRDYATMMLHSILLNKNTDIIRVHNVKKAVIFKKIYNEIHEKT